MARILAVELKDTTLDDEIWLPKLLTLQGLLQQHMSFEEETIIPIAKQILDQGTMNRLGIDFEREQKEALKNAQVIYE